MLLLIPLTLSVTNEDAFREVMSDSGWIDAGTKTEAGIGDVSSRHKPLDGVDCLEASAVTEIPETSLREVILDIEGNLQWSSADLKVSDVLSRRSGAIDYVQVLDLPAPFSSRYWFLRATVQDRPDSWSFIWKRIDPAGAYPDRQKALLEAEGDAVEITVNVGSWTLTPAEGGTLARFRSCTNVGGSVPRWAGEQAAKVMLPNNIVDLFAEARKRSGI